MGYTLIDPQPITIKAELVKDLIAAALEIGFFEMESEYTEESELSVTPDGTIEQGFGEILDGEATTYTIKIGNHKKSIYAHYGYPKRLDWFYQLILDITGVSDILEDWMHE